MKFLLDTHLLIWAAVSPQRLSPRTRALLNDTENELWFSTASIWELSIKYMLRADSITDPKILHSALLQNGYAELMLNSKHALAITYLPPIHKDPFDRIMIAQAIVEGVTFLTEDKLLAQYPAPVQCVG